MIKINNLSKKYGHNLAVSDLNLEVNRGELFGFIGPNGAGKTTTIKMIAGLLKPDTGKIFVDNIDISEKPQQAKAIIGLISDRPFLYEKLTGREYLTFVSQLYNVDKAVINKKADSLFEMFNLTGEADNLIEGYSQGMKQKLVMISVLIHEPKVIIVDEPMIGLDPRSNKLVKNIFLDLVKNGVTIFMSTHTLSLAEEICSRVGIIDHGNLIALGSIDELRSKSTEEHSSLEKIFLKLTEE